MFRKAGRCLGQLTPSLTHSQTHPEQFFFCREGAQWDTLYVSLQVMPRPPGPRQLPRGGKRARDGCGAEGAGSGWARGQNRWGSAGGSRHREVLTAPGRAEGEGILDLHACCTAGDGTAAKHRGRPGWGFT